MMDLDNNNFIPKLCLNMIVKNESKVIIRLLESVCNIIDGFCICDTGSTDDTVELIKTFFKKQGTPGKIIYEPFKDFGYNRSLSLRACADIPDMDYILLLDADMVLVIDPSINENITTFKKSLTADCYHILQGSHQHYYKNVRIVKNYKGYSYWGVTHEYVNTTPESVYESIPKDIIFINDIGDGGTKSDKFERDIRLLSNGLEEIPNNDRYTFYLANSYRDAGQLDKAIETFYKRVEIGGWIEEIWHSYYSIGICYMSLGIVDKAIYAWLQAYQAHPKRIESLYEIVKYYRENGKNELAYSFYVMADGCRKRWGSSDDYLFLQKDVYDYKLDYEMSIIGYYINNDKYNIQNICVNVLNYPYLPPDIKTNTISNYKFYAKKIIDISNKTNEYNIMTTLTDSLNIDSDGIFIKSTPSIILNGTNMIVNIRYVNYKVDDDGNYINQENIITKNAISVLDISKPIWNIVQEFELGYDNQYDDRYIGIEDIRLFLNDDKIIYNGNRGIKDTMTVENGEISLVTHKTLRETWPRITGHKHIEKNWALLPSNNINDNLVVVYNWNPDMIIGVFENNQFIETHRNKVPPFFKELRGSTNGIVINDEIWLICHTVSYEDRRYYYHVVVVLDRLYNILRYTSLFTFEGAKVEYTLGFVYLEKSDELLIGYSLYDKCAKYMSIERENIEKMMIENKN
jgi:tetratricopeptide (TPR) repeat protein